LPGETEATIRETIDFSKKLPLDIALFHVAAPYPGTPFSLKWLKMAGSVQELVGSKSIWTKVLSSITQTCLLSVYCIGRNVPSVNGLSALPHFDLPKDADFGYINAQVSHQCWVATSQLVIQPLRGSPVLVEKSLRT
jgi:hypothetical protein